VVNIFSPFFFFLPFAFRRAENRRPRRAARRARAVPPSTPPPRTRGPTALPKRCALLPI